MLAADDSRNILTQIGKDAQPRGAFQCDKISSVEVDVLGFVNAVKERFLVKSIGAARGSIRSYADAGRADVCSKVKCLFVRLLTKLMFQIQEDPSM